MSSSIVITSAGLNAIANNPTPAYSLRWFLPIYDKRLDPDIHSDTGLTSAAPISWSAYTSSSDISAVYGEKLWKLPNATYGYQLASSRLFAYTENTTSGDRLTTSFGSNILSNSTQERASKINILRNGTAYYALSETYSGTAVSADGQGSFLFTGGTTVPWTSGNVVPPLSTSANPTYLWSGITYTPQASSNGTLQGTFKCILPSTTGDFKFNKVALFWQKLNANGTNDLGTDPVLFAVATMNKAIEKTSAGTQLDSFELDVGLNFDTSGNNNIWYNTDYWTQLPSTNNQGLFYTGDVAVGVSGVAGAWEPNAKLHATDDAKPQLSLSYNRTGTQVDFKVNSLGALSITNSAYSQPNLQVGLSAQSTGYQATALGVQTCAIGGMSFVAGGYSKAQGVGAVALGYGNNSFGTESFSVGRFNDVNGSNAAAFGLSNSANNSYSLTVGLTNTNIGVASLACGLSNYTSGSYSINVGNSNSAIGNYSTVIGLQNITDFNRSYSIAMGYKNSATNNASISLGWQNYCDGSAAIAMGYNNSAYDSYSMVVGESNKALDKYSFAFGKGCSANPETSNLATAFAMGWQTSAGGDNAFAFGNGSIANGTECSLAFGYQSTASGGHSIAIGKLNKASSWASIAIGYANRSFSDESIAMGYNNYVHTDGVQSVALGLDGQVYGANSFAIGNANQVGQFGSSKNDSFAIGRNVNVTGISAIGIGYSLTLTANNTTEIKNDNIYLNSANIYVGSNNGATAIPSITAAGADIYPLYINSITGKIFYLT